MKSNGDKDELSEKKSHKWYSKQKKNDTYRIISNLIQSFFFEAITLRYVMLWNWTIRKIVRSIK